MTTAADLSPSSRTVDVDGALYPIVKIAQSRYEVRTGAKAIAEFIVTENLEVELVRVTDGWRSEALAAARAFRRAALVRSQLDGLAERNRQLVATPADGVPWL